MKIVVPAFYLHLPSFTSRLLRLGLHLNFVVFSCFHGRSVLVGLFFLLRLVISYTFHLYDKLYVATSRAKQWGTSMR
jgi:hypothetical protein